MTLIFPMMDLSLDNYRSIFKNYYNSPNDYDKEVLDSVHYMRNNRCVYYKQPIIKIGDNILDILKETPVLILNGTNSISLLEALGTDFKYAFIGAFSMS